MKRFLLAIVSFLILSVSANAAHIFGGEMIYEYLGPGSSPNTKQYRITLKLFRYNEGGGAQLPTDVFIGIFDYGTKQHYPITQTYYDVPKTGEEDVVKNVSPCAVGDLSGTYKFGWYSFTVDLPDNPQGYICAYETCCRIQGLQNVFNTAGPGGAGSTYVCRIPGTNQLPASQHNSSPQFITSLDLVCKDIPFTWNFSASDPDGDSLVYSFTSAYDKTIAQNAANVPPAPPSVSPPPDYPPLTYINGYTGAQPLGLSVSINPQTGIISGVAPGIGQYVTCVIIKEYRNGVQISEHRKDFILRVQDCDIPKATLTPKPTTCDGFNVFFSNETPSPLINTYFWDFGVPTLTNDTSSLPNPSYTYPYAGVFTVKLVTNRNQQCSDSTTVDVKVFPGFRPGFLDSGTCVSNPFRFFDTTATDYGVVDSWSWNFGDLTTLGDTSHIKNPLWTYATPGVKDVTLIVTNDKGCIDTAQTTIDVLAKPLITLAFNDALICIPDSITLNAGGTGTFSWTPNVNIINANTATPTVYPVVDTWYVANLDDNGCINQDSVHVRVTTGVSLSIRPDTTICLGDPVQLTTTTNGLAFLWTPSATLDNPTVASPIATPVDPVTTYQLLATIGTCFGTEDITIRTVPYPLSDAGPPQIICYNKSAQLNGSIVGNSFSWSPTRYLNDSTILNPVASPPRTTAYILTVFDNKGCPKPGRDTIVITVNPKVRAYAGKDTSVVIRQPVQMAAIGGVTYQWIPSTWLNNASIPNPVAIFTPGSPDSVRYKVVAKDNIGCPDTANVTIYIYQTAPTIFVPTAFTPNGDGLNDEVRPIAAGIRRIIYFSIYNRWGELVFTTTENRKGWDGRIAGVLQSSNVFVWMVQAEDYMGNKIFLKGTVTLIR